MIQSAIITGVGGFLGSHLCDRLLEIGTKIIGIDIISPARERLYNHNFTFIKASFEDYPYLHELIKDKADIFFHFAWAGGLLQNSFWNYGLQLQNAYYGCVAFEEACKIGCQRFINSGTNNQIEIMQFLNSMDFTPRGTDIYSASKTALELICKTLSTKYSTDFLGTMIPMPYGEGNKSMQLANVVIKKLIKGESPLLIEGNNPYDMVYIDDIINAFIEIADKGYGGRTYYIGHRKLKTFKEWITDIRNIINPNIKLNFGEYKDPLNLDYSYINLDLLYNDTGYEVNSDFKSTIERTAEWVKQNL